MNRRFHRTFDGKQQQSEFGEHCDLAFFQGDRAVYAAALEVQYITVPAMGHGEFLGDRLGDPIDRGFGLGVVFLVLVCDVDGRHVGFWEKAVVGGESCVKIMPEQPVRGSADDEAIGVDDGAAGLLWVNLGG